MGPIQRNTKSEPPAMLWVSLGHGEMAVDCGGMLSDIETVSPAHLLYTHFQPREIATKEPLDLARFVGWIGLQKGHFTAESGGISRTIGAHRSEIYSGDRDGYAAWIRVTLPGVGARRVDAGAEIEFDSDIGMIRLVKTEDA